jgi:guanine deaminase
LILAEEMHKAGISPRRQVLGGLQRSLADLLLTSFSSAKAFIEILRSKKYPVAEPVRTLRLVLTCSDEFLSGLGKIRKEMGVRVQSNMAESEEQAACVKEVRAMEDIEVFDKVCVAVSPYNFMALKLRSRQAGLLTLLAWSQPKSTAHTSPFPNLPHIHPRSIHSTLFLLQCLLLFLPIVPPGPSAREGGKVGLGSGISGGYSIGIQGQMRWGLGWRG